MKSDNCSHLQEEGHQMEVELSTLRQHDQILEIQLEYLDNKNSAG